MNFELVVETPFSFFSPIKYDKKNLENKKSLFLCTNYRNKKTTEKAREKNKTVMLNGRSKDDSVRDDRQFMSMIRQCSKRRKGEGGK